MMTGFCKNMNVSYDSNADKKLAESYENERPIGWSRWYAMPSIWYGYYTPGFNEVERGVYWFHVVPSVVSALYLPQY